MIVKELERTETSIPWLASDQGLVPIDLEAYGYEEKEYTYSDVANVYTLKDQQAQIKFKDAPYTNRFILRKPKQENDCSGRVVVEILNSTNGFDVCPMWSVLWKRILQEGDIYVGVTARAVCTHSLQIFDSQRYAELSWKNPNPNPGPVNHNNLMWQHSSLEDEDGLVWDMITQLSNYLKSEEGQAELNVKVDSVYATGCSQSAMLLTSYMNVFHESTRVSPVEPGFDGYLTYSGGCMLSLNQEEGPEDVNEPIQLTKNVKAPVIRVMSQWDFRDFAGNIRLRREDSDELSDRFRLYEMAGQAHNSFSGAFYRPGYTEMEKLGREAKLPPSNIVHLGLEAVLCQALTNLDAWVHENVAPPHAEWIEVDENTNEVLDEHGNCKGGFRYPKMDVPVATYHSGTDTNPQDSYYELFSQEKIKELYPTRKDYIEPIFEKIDNLYNQRFISLEDAEAMKEEALKVNLDIL